MGGRPTAPRPGHAAMTDAREPKSRSTPRDQGSVSSRARAPVEQRLSQAIRELAAPIDARDTQVKIDALLARLLPERPLPGNASRQRRRALVLAALTAARQSRGLDRALRRRRLYRLGGERRVMPGGLPRRMPGSSPAPRPLGPPEQSSPRFFEPAHPTQPVTGHAPASTPTGCSLDATVHPSTHGYSIKYI
jgi:hypothetical protein